MKGNQEATIKFDPGFGDGVERDRGTVEQLVNFLKEEIKHVNAFVILFNGQAFNRSLAKYLILCF